MVKKFNLSHSFGFSFPFPFLGFCLLSVTTPLHYTPLEPHPPYSGQLLALVVVATGVTASLLLASISALCGSGGSPNAWLLVGGRVLLPSLSKTLKGPVITSS